MKTINRFFCGLGLITILALPRGTQAAAGYSTYTGRVTSGGVGIAGVQFVASSPNGGTNSTALTDTNGNIAIPMWSSGDSFNPYYDRVTISRSGASLMPPRYDSWMADGVNQGILNAVIGSGLYSAQITNLSTHQGMSGVTVRLSGAPSVFKEVFPSNAIPDNDTTGVSIPIVVTNIGTVSSLKVFVAIRHTAMGDVEVSLIHPDGTTVLLLNQNDYGGMRGLNTLFPDLRAPVQSLTSFNGHAVAGTWKLKVRDLAPLDTGLINYFALSIASATDLSTIQTNGTTAANGSVALGNWGPGAKLTPIPTNGYIFSPTSAVVYPLVPATFIAGLTPVGGVGSSLSLNGVNQYVQVNDSPVLHLTNQMTLEAWVRTTSDKNQPILWKLGGGSGSENGFGLAIYSGELMLVTTANGWWDRLSFGSISTNEWHHVAAVWNRGQSLFYIDGVFVGGASSTSPGDTSEPLLIGTAQVASGWLDGVTNTWTNFTGQIAEVRLWNIARSGNQIASSLSAALPSNLPGLIAYCRFNENFGAVAFDSASRTSSPDQGGEQTGTVLNGGTYLANDSGLAAKMFLAITENTPRQIFLPAEDPSTTVTYSAVSATVGTLVPVSGGIYLYSPPTNYIGPVIISYTATGWRTNLVGALALQVQAINTPPVVGPGQGLSFNAATQYAFATNKAVIPTNGDFTVECWALAPANSGVTREILSQGDAGGGGLPFYLGVDASGKIRAGDGWMSTGVNYLFGGWHHLALVKNSTNTWLYLDGAIVATKGATIANPNAVRFALGAQYGTYGEYWNGNIADVRIWNVARDASQIAANRSAVLPNNTPGLVAYYRLNEGSGTTAFNSAVPSGAPNLALTNGPSYLVTSGPASALAFDGSAARVQIADAPANSPIGPLTVEAWIRPNVNASGAISSSTTTSPR